MSRNLINKSIELNFNFNDIIITNYFKTVEIEVKAIEVKNIN